MNQISAADFLDTLTGATIEKVDTDNHDVFISLNDKRVIWISAMGGTIILAQLSAMPVTVQ